MEEKNYCWKEINKERKKQNRLVPTFVVGFIVTQY